MNILLALAIFFPTIALADINSSRPTTYLEKIESARIVIIGKVQSITTTSVVDDIGVDEVFDIVKIKGNIIDSNGTRSRSDTVKLRTPRGAFYEHRSGRYVFILTGNDLEMDSTNNTFPWLSLPVLRVQGNKLYAGESKLSGIDFNGNLIFKKTNNCDISAFSNEASVTIKTPEGEVIKELSRDEVLDSVDSFECPDGSQWVRGRNGQRAHPGIKLKDFEEKLTQHLKSRNILPTSREEINRDVDKRSASKRTNITGTKYLDDVLVPLLESSIEVRDNFEYRELKKLYKRVERRRKRYESGQSDDLVGLFDWNEDPAVKALLATHNLIDPI